MKRIDWANDRLDTTTSGSSNKQILILGSGSYSDVVRGQLDMRRDIRDVAIKVLKPSRGGVYDYDKLCIDALKEADIIASATHRMCNKSGIVTLYGVAVGALTPELASFFELRDGQKRVGLVLGYEPTSLHKVLYPESSLKISMSTEQKIALVRSLIDALRNLHNAACVHGDLKPQNILLSGDVNSFQVKLADFNISELREAAQETAATKGNTRHTLSAKGTKEYCAVEQLPDPSNPGSPVTKASRRTGVFSLGVIIWEIFSGKPPHHELGNNNEGALCLKVHKGGRPSDILPGNIPDPSFEKEITNMPLALRELAKRCWDADKSTRPTATECYSTISQIQNVFLKKTFDIFFSHCWADKAILSHVYSMLTDLEFRVLVR